MVNVRTYTEKMNVVQLMMARQLGDTTKTRQIEAAVQKRRCLLRDILQEWRHIARRRTTEFQANSSGVLYRVRRHQ